jgi:predicted Zn-dependent protease
VLAGDLDKASQQADIVEKLTPDSADLSALHGAIALRRGDLIGAKLEAEEALQRSPGHGAASTVLAGVYARSGKTAEAIATLDLSITHDQKSVPLRLLKIKRLLMPVSGMRRRRSAMS